MIAHPALRRGRKRPPTASFRSRLVERARQRLRARCARGDRCRCSLSRQTKRLFDAAPKLRAKDAARVIEMLLDDDCVSPARAAKRAKLSDRSARRLFDRLIELNAVRELTGRANFRLYGL